MCSCPVPVPSAFRAYDPAYTHAFASRDQEVEIQDYKVLVERLEQLVSLSAHFYFHDAPKQTKKKLQSAVCSWQQLAAVFTHIRIHWGLQICSLCLCEF